MTEDTSTFRKDIEGLRALGIFAVLLFHAWPHALPSGYAGVDVFFVISGYLITGVILKAQSTQGFSFAEFYRRRIRRLLPALIPVLVACQIVGANLLLRSEYLALCEQIRAGGFFILNIVEMSGAGYFSEKAPRPLFHLWSLGMEEQFYLLWPAFIVFLTNRRLNAIFWSVFVGCISFAVHLAMLRHFRDADYYSLPSRLWELMVGAVLMMYERGNLRGESWGPLRRLSGSAYFADVMAASGLVAMACGILGFGTPMAVFGAAFLIAAGPRTLLNRAISRPPMEFIGGITYPLYLWHVPILAFARIEAGRDLGLGEVWTCLGLSFVLAVLTYYLVERPLRNQYRLRKTATAVALFGALMLCSCYAWYVLKARVPSLLAESTSDIDLKYLDRPAPSSPCPSFPHLEWTACRRSLVGVEPSVAILGDSIAWYLFSGLAEEYRKEGIGVVVSGVQACPPFATAALADNPYIKTRDCVGRYAKILDFLHGFPSIKSVIITFDTGDPGVWDFADLPRTGNYETERTRRVAKIFNEFAEKIEAGGRHVIYVTGNPTLRADPHSCLTRSWGAISLREDCAIAAIRSKTSTSEFYRLLKPSICVFDPSESFLTGDSAWVARNGRVYYLDRYHLGNDGSAMVAAAFRQSACYAYSK